MVCFHPFLNDSNPTSSLSRYLGPPKDAVQWPSPAYPGLMGNVLPKFLSFSRHPAFPPPSTSPSQPFPSLAQTYAYLKDFAQPLLAAGKIRLNTEVLRVEELPLNEGWHVSVKEWGPEKQGSKRQEKWDAVVIATAWYDSPRWPDTPGLDDVRKAGLAVHAKVWEGPNVFKGKVCSPVSVSCNLFRDDIPHSVSR